MCQVNWLSLRFSFLCCLHYWLTCVSFTPFNLINTPMRSHETLVNQIGRTMMKTLHVWRQVCLSCCHSNTLPLLYSVIEDKTEYFYCCYPIANPKNKGDEWKVLDLVQTLNWNRQGIYNFNNKYIIHYVGVHLCCNSLPFSY